VKQDYIQQNPMIIRAIGEAMDRKVKRIPIVEYVFSPTFERKMNRLIRIQSKPYYRFVDTSPKKAVLALAAALVLMIAMVFSVSALREPVVRFIVEVYEKFSSVFFHSGEEELAPPLTLEAIYEPAWIPEGYVLDDEDAVATDIFRISYFSKGDDIIVFQQHIISFGVNLDTEGAEIHPAVVHGNNAILYHNKDIWTLVWNDDQYGYSLSGPVGDNDLLRMGESLREK